MKINFIKHHPEVVLYRYCFNKYPDENSEIENVLTDIFKFFANWDWEFLKKVPLKETAKACFAAIRVYITARNSFVDYYEYKTIENLHLFISFLRCVIDELRYDKIYAGDDMRNVVYNYLYGHPESKKKIRIKEPDKELILFDIHYGISEFLFEGNESINWKIDKMLPYESFSSWYVPHQYNKSWEYISYILARMADFSRESHLKKSLDVIKPVYKLVDIEKIC